METRQRKIWKLRRLLMHDFPKKNDNSRLFGSSLTVQLVLALTGLASFFLTETAASHPLFPVFVQNLHHTIVSEHKITPTPVAVFGKDQRQSLPKRYKNLDRQIGLLHNPRTNTLCTAFCVGPDMIATASHCLFSQQKKWNLHLSDFLFKLKGKNGSNYSRLAGYRSRQSRQFIITGTSKLNRKPPIGAARDWAIVRLERPGCKNGWLKTENLPHNTLRIAADKKRLFQVAYHMDYRNWQIAYSTSCTVNRNYGGLSWRSIKKHFSAPQFLILHQCDTGEASSGSPILMESKNGPLVVGINVGTYQQREITVKNGRVVRRSKYKTIANTAVSATAFSRAITLLKQANVIKNRDQLKTLQLSLKDRGYYHGAIDGVYGARTELAIKAFERSLRHTVTGLATKGLLDEFDKNRSGPVAIETSAGYRSTPALPGK